jgi:hypothetical protein
MSRSRSRHPRLAVLLAALAGARAAVSGHARAALDAGATSSTAPPPAEPEPEGEPETAEVEAVEAEGFVLPPGTDVVPPLTLMGYVDFGFADAGGDGTSFAPGDNRVPADYGVDPFAPAVNSRGDVASIDAGGRVTNGFLPRSVNIAGRPSFLLNAVNQDLRYQSPHVPVMAFVRLQVLPRWGGDGAGNVTPLYVEQAFGRITPIEGYELTLSGGKFDSVFGIEYLDNSSVFRTGITPSLFARYTTGTALGLKAFYRQQIPGLWSAVSLNIAATNSSNFVEALQPTDASLTGVPVLSGRFGYELNLPRVQVKLGASALRGPRNDQFDRRGMMEMFGFDARLYVAGVSLSGEYVYVDEEEGAGGKQTGAGGYPIASEFYAMGFWTQAAYALTLPRGALRAITPYARYERRHAWFEGFRPITVARVTVGLRFELWRSLILKGELLLNQELAGAPTVDNDVLTTSVVYSW